MSNKKATNTQRKTEGKTTFKNSLFQPYILNWPLLEKGDNHFILNTLSQFFENHPELKKVRSLGKRKLETTNKSSTEKVALRQFIVTGVNAVTKKLEKGQLDLVLVCRSANPALITQHLIPLSATRKISSTAISGLSNCLSPLLNFKSVLAIGFIFPKEAESPEDLQYLISEISDKVKPIKLPWITTSSYIQSESENTVKSKQQSTFAPTQICINKSIANKKQRKK